MQDANRRAIDSRDFVFRVKRDHTRRQRFQHGLDVPASFAECDRGRFKRRRHFVKGRNEQRELVLGKYFDAVAEIAAGDLIGALGQCLDRLGESTGDVKRYPRRRKDKQERQNAQRQQSDAAYRDLLLAQTIELGERLVDRR